MENIEMEPPPHSFARRQLARLGDYADTGDGADVIRAGLAFMAAGCWFWLVPNAGEHVLSAVAAWHLGPLVVLLIFMPGVSQVLLLLLRVLIFALIALDVILFFVPRGFLRSRVGLSAGAAFALALVLELSAAYFGCRHIARAERPPPPLIVGAGVHLNAHQRALAASQRRRLRLY